jgi:probable rRNA maturation factor
MTDKPPDPLGAHAAELVVECALPAGLDPTALGHAGERLLHAAGVDRDTHLTVTLVDLPRMASLKEQAFGVHAATDVLAFGVDDPADPGPGPFVLGDVVICPEVAARQARTLGHSALEEVTTLMAHGILHLLGHDHADAPGERTMAAEQARLVGVASS